MSMSIAKKYFLHLSLAALNKLLVKVVRADRAESRLRMRNFWSMFWTQMILCSWGIVSKLNVVVLRQSGHFFDENN